jgi:Leucine-rich repeat (LRR) protein
MSKVQKKIFSKLRNFTNDDILDGQIIPLIGEIRIPSSLPNLETINLSKNYGIRGRIPAALFEIPSIQDINLSCNEFTSLPTNIHHAKLLSKLNLGDNRIHQAIPSRIGETNNLKVLNLMGNRFIGEIPKSIINLTKLNNFKCLK